MDARVAVLESRADKQDELMERMIDKFDSLQATLFNASVAFVGVLLTVGGGIIAALLAS